MNMPALSSFEDYERELRTWTDRLKLVDTLIEKPARTIMDEVGRGLAEGKRNKSYVVASSVGERGRGTPAPLLVHAICCSVTQRLWGQRRRFPWIAEKELKALVRGKDEKDKGLLDAFMELESGANADPLQFLALLNDQVFGAANALTSAEVFWVLIKAGEQRAQSPLGFFCVFAMLWSISRGAKLPTPGGASLEPWRPSALVTAKCLLPLRTLTGFLRRRAHLYEEIASTYEKLAENRANATQRQRWLFATDLEALSSHLHEFATVAFNPGDFELIARHISSSAGPITPEFPQVVLNRIFNEVTAYLARLLADSANAAAPVLERSARLLDNVRKDIVAVLSDPAKRKPLEQYFIAPANDTGYWKSHQAAARQAYETCSKALQELRKGVDELKKYSRLPSPPPQRLPQELAESLRVLSTVNRSVAEFLEDAVKPSTLWMRRVMTQEVAYASAGNETDFDAAELLSAVTIVQRWQRISDLEVEDALKWSLKGARSDGSWTTGQPILMKQRFLGVWPSTPDIVWLLAMAVEQKKKITIADEALMSFVGWLDKTRTDAAWPETNEKGRRVWKEATGWPSETREPDAVDLWSTALSVNALLSIRDLIENRLWAICERRFFVQKPPSTLMKIDPVDLGARHEGRLHRRFMKMARDTTGDAYASAEYSLVLHGPPGSSKTALAEALADAMWPTSREARLIRITPADFTRQGEERVDSEARFIFDLLSRVRGATIFFDEIDQLLQRRTPGEELVFLKLVVPAMLNRLQDLRDAAPRQELCFVFATNFVDTIDPALTRPGRIDATVPVPYPDPWSRENVMERIFEEAPPLTLPQQQRLLDETSAWPWSTFQKLCKELKAKRAATVQDVGLRIDARKSDFEEISTYYKDSKRLDSSRAFVRELVHATFSYAKDPGTCREKLAAITDSEEIAKIFAKEWKAANRPGGSTALIDKWQPVTGTGDRRLGVTVSGPSARFRVWAPYARRVAVAGTFNNWASTDHVLEQEAGFPGYWVGDVADIWTNRVPKPGEQRERRSAIAKAAPAPAPAPQTENNGPEDERLPQFRYVITTDTGEQIWKSEPFSEELLERKRLNVLNSVIPKPLAAAAFTRPDPAAMVIYQLHPATFSGEGDTAGTLLTAVPHLAHLKSLGINAVEILMLGDRSYDEPWGWDAEYPLALRQWSGGAEALRTFIAEAHEHGIAVIAGVAWQGVGRLTSYDAYGNATEGNLWRFDGSPSDAPEQGGIYYDEVTDEHGQPTMKFDLEQPEVRDYLYETVMRWAKEFGIDGLRWNHVEAIANPGKEKNACRLLRDVNRKLERLGVLTVAQHDGQPEPVALCTEMEFASVWRRSFMARLHAVLHQSEPQPTELGALADAINALSEPPPEWPEERPLPWHVVYSDSYRESQEGRFPRYQSDTASRRNRATVAAVIVFTVPGIPMLYQRQEDLADGKTTPTSRIDWNAQDRGMRALYKALIRLRTAEPSLAALRERGTDVSVAERVLVIHRYGGRDDALVVVNPTYEHVTRTIEPRRMADWVVRLDTASDELGTAEERVYANASSLTLELEPWSALILSPRNSRPSETKKEM
jgi:1,4-alpha-glucan branching enzyme